jgi:hypothetical protein
MAITCPCCGHNQEVDCARCNNMILCVTCRAIRAKAKSEAFLASREVIIADGRDQGRLHHNRPGGRWGERMVTLTVPHFRDHSLEQRFAFLLDAWPHFLRCLNVTRPPTAPGKAASLQAPRRDGTEG